MKLLVFGATGKTGRLVVERALAKHHEVTVLVRDATKLGREGVRILVGDARTFDDVRKAVQGQDAVIGTIGGTTPWKETGLEGATMRNIVQAMKVEGVKRLAAISMMGVGDSKAQAPLFYRYVLMPTFLRGTTRDKTAMEREIEASGLDYVIARAPILGGDTATGHVKILPPGKTGHKITRADLAVFLVDQIDSDANLRKAVTVANS